MRLDSLERLVSSADFSTFRQIALTCLEERGFMPSLTDGPHDGGADFLSYVLAPGTTKFVVQISVEKNWQSKLRKDAAKAKRKLGAEILLFVSTRTITQAAFQEVADDLQRTLNVQAQKMDAKDIASLAERKGFTPKILESLGISVPTVTPKPFERPDLRRNLAYACAFFGTDAQAFRATVIENAAIAVVFAAGGSSLRTTIADRVSLSLGLASSQVSQVNSAIDRMLQDGRLSGKNGIVTLDGTTKSNWASMSAIQQKDRFDLDRQLDALLAPHLVDAARRKDVLGAIVEDLGALWLDTGRATSNALGDAESAWLSHDGLRSRIRHLDALLDTLGVIDRASREKLLGDLSGIAAGSPLGRALIAGEVFINLVSLNTPHVLQAFGGGKRLVALLDTSVAMPLLCSLLYTAAAQQFFVAAKHAYEQLVAHRASMVLPRDYLEEVASHLREAYAYKEIVELDPDLRASQNAFVAHYAALRAAEGEKAESYSSYLAGLGFAEAMANSDRDVVRDILMNKLQRLFTGYGIETNNLPASASSLKRAQEAFAFAMKERGDEGRPPILIRHDVVTVGWLLDRGADADATYLLCTWDKLHPYVQVHEEANWDVLDPVALGDVLSLAAPEGEEVKIVAPTVVALMLSVEAEQKGAAVWDDLVRIEKEGLHDARLRHAAREFKKDWVERAAKEKRSRDLQKEWEAWKVAHLPKSSD